MSRCTFEQRVEQLLQYEHEHGHMFVPDKYNEQHGLGTWCRNAKARKKAGHLNPAHVAKLNEIGFFWTVPSSSAKEALIAWGKMYRILVEHFKSKGHCHVPPMVGGQSSPIYAWCQEQRRLYVRGLLDQGNIDKLKRIEFDFQPAHDGSDDEKKPVSILCHSLVLDDTSLRCNPYHRDGFSYWQPAKRKRGDDDDNNSFIDLVVLEEKEELQKKIAELQNERQSIVDQDKKFYDMYEENQTLQKELAALKKERQTADAQNKKYFDLYQENQALKDQIDKLNKERQSHASRNEQYYELSDETHELKNETSVLETENLALKEVISKLQEKIASMEEHGYTKMPLDLEVDKIECEEKFCSV